MANRNENKTLQVEAVRTWLRSLDHSRRSIPHDDQVSSKSQGAFWKFSQDLSTAICGMIDGMDGDEDAILFAMIQMAQMVGIRAALINHCPGCAMAELMSGTMAMVDSYHAAVRAMDERAEAVGEVLEDVVHGPIQ